MKPSADDPVTRLTRALELFLAHKSAPTEPRDAFLACHAELRELLEPMFDDPTDHVAAPERSFGPYRVLGEIARGGMGIVHDALHPGLNRRVALKLLAYPLAASPQAIARFRREAEFAGRLDHPHIVRVHDAGVIDGVPYHAMERIDGGTLADVLRTLAVDAPEALGGDSLADAHARSLADPSAGRWLRGKSHVDATLQLALAIADALAAAHAAGILHRDVKPANVLLRRNGLPLLSDFGLARDEQDPALSRTGDFAGTPFYVSPEQAAGDRARIGPGTDVFALAVVTYEILFLARPFDGTTTTDVLHAVQHAEPRALMRRDHGLPADLVAVLDKALRKDPADRYPTMAAFATELRAVRELRPVQACQRGVLTRTWQRVRAQPRRAMQLAAFLACLALAAGSWIHLDAQRDRIVAGTELEKLPRVDHLLQTVLLQQECGEADSGLAAAREANRLLPEQPETLAAVCLAAHIRGETATVREFLVRLQRTAPDVAAQLSDTTSAGEPVTSLGWFVRGRRLLGAGHGDGDVAVYQQAATCFRRAIDRAVAPREMFHCELLHALVHVRDFPTALALGDDMLHRWPESPFVAYWRGRLLEESAPDRAIAELHRAARDLPDLPQPLERLAQAHERAGQHGIAAELARQLLARWPQQAKARMSLVRCLLAQRQPEAALREADLAIAQSPTYWALVSRADALRKLGRNAEAATAYDAAIERGPKAALPLRARAEFRLALGKGREALTDAERACELEPRNTAAHSTRGIALLHAGRPRDAIAALELVVADWPWSDDNWRALAQAHRRDGAFDKAAEAIGAALRTAPDDIANQVELGKLQNTRGEHELAEATFRRVLQAAPKDYESAVNLAGLHWRRGELAAALPLLTMAREVNPSLPDAWDASIRLLTQMGRHRDVVHVRADFCAARPRDRAARLALIEGVLALPAEPGDPELLQRTFTELGALDGEERADVTGLRMRAAERLALPAAADTRQR